MRYPPRLSHLANRAVLIAKLAPTYADAHRMDEEEAALTLERALDARLTEDLLEATWKALLGTTKRLDDAALLEKVAKTLQDRPLRPGRRAAITPGWSAFLVLADVQAGTASDAARKVIETEDGRRRVEAGLSEVGQHLARELTRK